jgi:hypothetical protein
MKASEWISLEILKLHFGCYFDFPRMQTMNIGFKIGSTGLLSMRHGFMPCTLNVCRLLGWKD